MDAAFLVKKVLHIASDDQVQITTFSDTCQFFNLVQLAIPSQINICYYKKSYIIKRCCYLMSAVTIESSICHLSLCICIKIWYLYYICSNICICICVCICWESVSFPLWCRWRIEVKGKCPRQIIMLNHQSRTAPAPSPCISLTLEFRISPLFFLVFLCWNFYIFI